MFSDHLSPFPDPFGQPPELLYYFPSYSRRHESWLSSFTESSYSTDLAYLSAIRFGARYSVLLRVNVLSEQALSKPKRTPSVAWRQASFDEVWEVAMGEKGGKEDAKRYSGVGGVAEAGGLIPWLIIKIVQGVTKRLRKK